MSTCALIFMGIDCISELDGEHVIRDYPGIIDQRKELDYKRNWRKSLSTIPMILMYCNGKKIVHVNIPQDNVTYNNIADIFLKIGKNKWKLGNSFTIYPVNTLNSKKFRAIVSEISSNEGVDTTILV